MPYSWSCSCGDGGALALPTWDAARLDAELHVCRAGRLRPQHRVHVHERAAGAALA